jgi:hypothetical protein
VEELGVGLGGAIEAEDGDGVEEGGGGAEGVGDGDRAVEVDDR